MTRRAWLALLTSMVIDPERLLWIPGRKLISIPATVELPAIILDTISLTTLHYLRDIPLEALEDEYWAISSKIRRPTKEREERMAITLKADMQRYGSIAARWPPTIVLPDCTPEQLECLQMHGLYEAGCDDLYYIEDEDDRAGD